MDHEDLNSHIHHRFWLVCLLFKIFNSFFFQKPLLLNTFITHLHSTPPTTPNCPWHRHCTGKRAFGSQPVESKGRNMEGLMVPCHHVLCCSRTGVWGDPKESVQRSGITNETYLWHPPISCHGGESRSKAFMGGNASSFTPQRWWSPYEKLGIKYLLCLSLDPLYWYLQKRKNLPRDKVCR